MTNKELLIEQNQNLTQTRDLFLPRLISGKLKVPACAEASAGNKGAVKELEKA